MRTFLTLGLILILFSCRTTRMTYGDEFGFRIAQELDYLEHRQLYHTFINYKKANGHWPTTKTWDSLKSSDRLFSRFSNVEINANETSVEVKYKINYEESYSSIKSMSPQFRMQPMDSGYSYGGGADKVTLQGDIDIYPLTNGELRREFGKLEQKRKSLVTLTAQDLKSKEITDISIGTRFIIYLNTDTPNDTEKNRREWELERISVKDSTINIGLRGGGILQGRLQLADIDSIRLTKDNRTFKIIGTKK